MILWYNAKFYTMENENKYYDEIITKSGIIVAVGDECKDYDVSEKHDLKKSHVYPGFTDSHMHLLGFGRKLSRHNLNNIKDKEHILKTIKNLYVEEMPLIIEGYFDVGITNKDLDEITTSDYIILRHNDYHSFTINSKLSKILFGKESNGIINNDFDAKKVVPYFENNNKKQLTTFGIKAIKELYKNGITSIHTDDLSYFNSYSETNDILYNLTSKYPIRINTLINYDIFDEYIKSYNENKYLNPIQVKLFYDGTISSKTAYLNENYLNENHNGFSVINKNELIDIIKTVRKYDKGVAVHVIGDKALDEVLAVINSFKKASELDRIVHASLASYSSLNNFNETVIDIQPLFIKSDIDIINKYINQKNVLIYPFKEYLNNNIILNGSSDAPVESINPLTSLVEIMKKDISNFEAIKTYTVNPYLTIKQKGGLIKKGYLADFTAFNKNILKVSNDEMLNTNICFTIIDEKIVYKNI